MRKLVYADGVPLRFFCVPLSRKCQVSPGVPPIGRLTRPNFRTYSAQPDC